MLGHLPIHIDKANGKALLGIWQCSARVHGTWQVHVPGTEFYHISPGQTTHGALSSSDAYPTPEWKVMKYLTAQHDYRAWIACGMFWLHHILLAPADHYSR